MGATAEVKQFDALRWLQAKSMRHPLDDIGIDLVIGSPPYALKGQRYGDRKQSWETTDWVKWMADVTYWACMASRGWVIWVANGAVRDGEYQPACEGLIWTLRQEHSDVVLERPCIWHKNSAPNRKDWFVNDWEFIMAFRHRDMPRPEFDWEAIAHEPKYSAGGDFRQRDSNGTRRKGGSYPKGKLARPRDVIRCTVGGGHLGSKLAHENEAPYPEELIRPFIKACCPKFCCSQCGNPVRDNHENADMPAVLQQVSNLGVQERAKPLLLKSLPSLVTQGAKGQLQGVSQGDQSHSTQCGGEVLQQDVRKSMDCKEQGVHEVSSNNQQGLRDAVHSNPPPGYEKGVRHGAPCQDGEEAGEATDGNRSRPSQKRTKRRQSTVKFGVDEQVEARFFAQAKEADHLSEMRPHNCTLKVCAKCGADLMIAGAIRLGVVADPFSGSGTTASVAIQEGRSFVGCDAREDQVELTKRRIAETEERMKAKRQPAASVGGGAAE